MENKLKDQGNCDKNEFEKNYSEASLFDKLLKFAKNIGVSSVYAILLLFYALQKNVPFWAKSTIVGALGYFITPLDVITDITPIIGFTDDIGILLAALVAVAFYIDEEVRQKAKQKLRDWFGEYDESELFEIDEKLNKSKATKVKEINEVND